MRREIVLLGLLIVVQIGSAFEGESGGGTPRPNLTAFAPEDEERGTPPTMLVVEALPHAPRDNEFIAIANPGGATVNGLGWTLTDGEGSWTLPALSIPPGGTIHVTRNGSALWEDAGLEADACVLGCPAAVVTRGSLALRNGGDGLQLLDSSGTLADALLYGKSPPISGWVGAPVQGLAKGFVARRQPTEDGWLDTDTSTDWMWNRPFRLGQSRRPPASYEDVSVQPLLSPDDSLGRLLYLLGYAQTRIDLAGFTLTNLDLARALRDALDRGVRVRIGLEESPPGGVGPEGEQILEDLHRAGAQILLMGSHGEGAWRRYAFHHAKYILVDDAWVVVGSENFSSNGFPSGPGNRGWGVAVQDAALAAWFREVWTEDWDENRSDVQSLARGAGPPPDAPDRPILAPEGAPPLLASVTAFLAPDSAVVDVGLPEVLRRARDQIDAELFYLRWQWGDSLNPLVAALVDAAGRGVRVRVLLDGQPYNVAQEEDNDEAVGRLNRFAAEAELPLEARLFPGDPRRIVKIHNKGLLVDGNRVWISSMNWNEAGAYANREAALLVDSREIAGVFQEAFEADWEQAAALGATPASADPPKDLFLWIGLGSAAAAGAWWWVVRTTKQPTNKHPRKTTTWRRRLKRRSFRSRRRRSRSTRTAR
ncbi:MAG: phospholipase D-like domain-containing protein [Thermoplasmata archaeon]